MFAFTNANNANIFNNANDVIKTSNAHMFVAPINNNDENNNIIKRTIEFAARVLIAYISFQILSFIVAGFVSALTISFGLGFSLFGWMFNLLWDNLNEGQQWIEIACMVSSIAVTATFLKLIHDENITTDNYIDKLKADLAAKNALIVELTKIVEELKDLDVDLDLDENEDLDLDLDEDLDLDAEYNEEDDWETISSSSIESDGANDDSDYDPEEDEY
jgi:hypothetical protein